MYTHEDLKRNKAALDNAYADMKRIQNQIDYAHNPGLLGSMFSSRKDRMKKVHRGGLFSSSLKAKRHACYQRIKRLKQERELMKKVLFK